MIVKPTAVALRPAVPATSAAMAGNKSVSAKGFTSTDLQSGAGKELAVPRREQPYTRPIRPDTMGRGGPPSGDESPPARRTERASETFEERAVLGSEGSPPPALCRPEGIAL